MVKVNEHMYLTNGWNEFAKNNIVEFLDFIILKFVKNSTSKVKIFGKSFCDKKLYMARNTNTKIKMNGLTKYDKAQMNPITQN